MRVTRIEIDRRTGVTTVYSNTGTYGTGPDGKWLYPPPPEVQAEAHKAALALGKLTTKARAKPKPKG